MALVVVSKPMYNAPERVEYYLALAAFPEVPMPTPRVASRDELIAVIEHYLEVAKDGELVEVKL